MVGGDTYSGVGAGAETVVVVARTGSGAFWVSAVLELSEEAVIREGFDDRGADISTLEAVLFALGAVAVEVVTGDENTALGDGLAVDF